MLPPLGLPERLYLAAQCLSALREPGEVDEVFWERMVARFVRGDDPAMLALSPGAIREALVQRARTWKEAGWPI